MQWTAHERLHESAATNCLLIQLIMHERLHVNFRRTNGHLYRSQEVLQTFKTKFCMQKICSTSLRMWNFCEVAELNLKLWVSFRAHLKLVEHT